MYTCMTCFMKYEQGEIIRRRLLAQTNIIQAAENYQPVQDG